MSAETIARLNDTFRTTFSGGRVVYTAGVREQGEGFLRDTIQAVQSFSEFSEDNDPHGERDFGVFSIGDERLFWKIDYYDAACVYGSENPANPEVTTRVLTIMLASEY